MNLETILSNINVIQTGVALLAVAFTLIITIIKVLNTTFIELLLAPRHKKILHDLGLAIFFSIIIFSSIVYLSFQAAIIIDEESFIYAIISLLFIVGSIIFFMTLICVYCHSLVLAFKEYEVVKKRTYKNIALTCVVSLIVSVFTLNVLLFIDEINVEDTLMLLLSEFVFTLAIFLFLPHYIKKLINSGHKYGVYRLTHKEVDLFFADTPILLYSIKPDIQVMKRSFDTNLKPDLPPVYIFYVQAGVVEKIDAIKKNTIEKEKSNFHDAIWKYGYERSTKYIKKNFNLEKVHSKNHINKLKTQLIGFDEETLKRALNRGKSLKETSAPGLMLAILVFSLQIFFEIMPISHIYTYLFILVIFVYAVMRIRQERIIAIHFIDLIEECIKEKSKIRDN